MSVPTSLRRLKEVGNDEEVGDDEEVGENVSFVCMPVTFCLCPGMSWDPAWSNWSYIELGQVSAWLIRQL